MRPTELKNLDPDVVDDFGDEWSRFDQTGLSQQELRTLWEQYFSIFPWDVIPPDARGFDLGCGSGRWAALTAERVGHLVCVEPSRAVEIARKTLRNSPKCVVVQASVDDMPIGDGTMDFGYSLGVLHHVPDTLDALRQCVSKLKPGAPFLVYLYYAFDNRPGWYRAIWRASDFVRRATSRLPVPAKHRVADFVALSVYWPLAKSAHILEGLGVQVEGLPLAAYRDRSFYAMRTDALDRFGTRLEKRYTRDEIATMMHRAGLENILFSDQTPFWCAVGTRARSEL